MLLVDVITGVTGAVDVMTIGAVVTVPVVLEAATVNVNTPVPVGVPDTRPVVGSKVMPSGKAPDAKA